LFQLCTYHEIAVNKVDDN